MRKNEEWSSFFEEGEFKMETEFSPNFTSWVNHQTSGLLVYDVQNLKI